ncbi:MAG: glycogen synthase [Deltaproteobacteria bacterium]|nr:glycogen synthase [Deltaproteobacteria bacterium]
MKILVATSEIAPYSQSCEIAETCRALPKALRGLDHTVTVVSPLYQSVDPERYSLARRLNGLSIEVGERDFACDIYDGRTAGGVDLLFVGNASLFADYTPGNSSDTESDALRAVLFSRAVTDLLKSAETPFDIVQVYDWMAYLSVVLIKKRWPLLPVILPLHDLDRQGSFSVSLDTFIGTDSDILEAARLSSRWSLLKCGILWADKVVTAAPGGLEGINKKGRADGLRQVLRSNLNKIAQILNGLDSAIWNPITDVHLRFRFDPNNLEGKQRCKAAFQHHLCLPIKPDTPLIATANDLSPEQGRDLLGEAAGRILRNDVQLVIICAEERETREELQQLAERYPDRMKIVFSNDEALIHQTIAASDFFLMPFRREPFGALQLSALRYGSLPIARKNGSGVDIVVDCDGGLQTGNGFVFEADDADELVATVQRALAAFCQPSPFARLRQRAMKLDRSWDRTARHYDYLYRRVVSREG